MSDRYRNRLPLSYFHVMNRGARRMGIFSEDAHYGLFVTLLGRFALDYGVPVIAWCLVINHYHAILRATGEVLWKMLRDLEKTYSRYFNKKVGLSGCLFQGPFKSVPLPDNEAVAYVSRYVHGNARDMGKSPEEYPWSSARYYLGQAPVPMWMNIRPAIDGIGGTLEAYRGYLRELPPKRRKTSSFDEAHSSFITHLENRCSRVADSYPGVKVGTLVAWKAHKVFGIPHRALADYFGYSSSRCVSAIVSRFDNWLDESPDLRERLVEC